MCLTWRDEANCERLVEDANVRSCTEQSSDEADLGDEDGEADQESKGGFEDKDISSHILDVKIWKGKQINIEHYELSLNRKCHQLTKLAFEVLPGNEKEKELKQICLQKPEIWKENRSKMGKS